jgi:hypothetical protein
MVDSNFRDILTELSLTVSNIAGTASANDSPEDLNLKKAQIDQAIDLAEEKIKQK